MAKKDLKNFLQKISLDERLNQHFLIDEEVIDCLIDHALIEENEEVIDIGAGTGIISEKLAERGAAVTAVEIDEQFKPFLEKIPGINKLLFCDALELLVNKKYRNFCKIVANLPFQTAEPIMQYLTNAKHVQRAALIVPDSFASLAKENPIYTSFLNISIEERVSEKAFYPIPKTYSRIIVITRRESYEQDNDLGAYIIRKLYLQGDKLVKNALKDIFIDICRMRKELPGTKRKAREFIKEIGLPNELLEKKVEGMGNENYKLIAKAFAGKISKEKG